jgi:hypothetical protein
MWAAILLLGAGQAAAEEESPRMRTESALKELDAPGSTAAKSNVAKEPRERSRALLKRANEARQANQEARARLLEDFALEWAETGKELLRAHALEARASELERRLTEIESRVRRARVLLEETETRRGRARAEVLRLDPSAEGSAAPTSSTAPSGSAAPSAGTAPSAAPTPAAGGAK